MPANDADAVSSAGRRGAHGDGDVVVAAPRARVGAADRARRARSGIGSARTISRTSAAAARSAVGVVDVDAVEPAAAIALAQARRVAERGVGGRADHEAGGHGQPGGGQLAEVRPLAAGEGDVGARELLEGTDEVGSDWWWCHRREPKPAAPCSIGGSPRLGCGKSPPASVVAPAAPRSLPADGRGRLRETRVLHTLRDRTNTPPEPPALAHTELVETHISWVFLTADRALKVKKPIAFPFLDYRDPVRRRELCEEELRLNRRLAPDLYLGVRGLVPDDGGWVLTDPGDPAAVEWAVEMRRFDERDTLAARVAAGTARPELVAEVGALLAEFHRAAERVPAGHGALIAASIDENFDALAEAEAIATGELRAARRFAAAFLAAAGESLQRRAAAGLVRDGHGDLRAEHVVLGERSRCSTASNSTAACARSTWEPTSRSW